MKTFSKETKQMLLDRIAAHERADEIAKGVYWQNGKGCAVGCLVHGNDHLKLANLIGIDVRVVFVVDAIFEGLPDAEAKTFPRQFVEAIPTNTDLSLTWPRFAHALLVDPTIGVIRFASGSELLRVARLYRRWINSGKQPASELFDAAADAAYATSSAARTAALAASSAARTVTYAASAVVDASRAAAYDAALAASTAADAAEAKAATDSAAARAAAWQSQRDLLLKLVADRK